VERKIEREQKNEEENLLTEDSRFDAHSCFKSGGKIPHRYAGRTSQARYPAGKANPRGDMLLTTKKGKIKRTEVGGASRNTRISKGFSFFPGDAVLHKISSRGKRKWCLPRGTLAKSDLKPIVAIAQKRNR